jgi:hypothetical protein
MGLTPEQIDAINKASDTSETIEKQLIEEGAVDDLVKQVKDITQGNFSEPGDTEFCGFILLSRAAARMFIEAVTVRTSDVTKATMASYAVFTVNIFTQIYKEITNGKG